MKVERLAPVITTLHPNEHPYLSGAWTPLHEEVNATDLDVIEGRSQPTWTASTFATPRIRSISRWASTTPSTATA